jgi:hypothetical protein
LDCDGRHFARWAGRCKTERFPAMDAGNLDC